MPDKKPIPMLLWCPQCHERHIDEGEFATRPHKTHTCQSCGMEWRPSNEPTVGVQFLPGHQNSKTEAQVPTWAKGQLELHRDLLVELDKLWGLDGLVDVHVEQPRDYLLVLGHLVHLAKFSLRPLAVTYWHSSYEHGPWFWVPDEEPDTTGASGPFKSERDAVADAENHGFRVKRSRKNG